ncbi:hypothetical protein RhiirA5_425248 [Rhizophagus irregularis]|uniref:Uncharacterized protein n=2 Tax=Rhizophagus irregularis TaxID=588596 RepID=A0A2N0P6G0_9GLOM|nr:hypothetical protein RhiirA5_425248 [Rhizophagus irregularis]PKC57658.1 hypothetical protein RhiirA1_472168 [Rhizophagus irregularis]
MDKGKAREIPEDRAKTDMEREWEAANGLVDEFDEEACTQRVLPMESKNISIYKEDIETAYLEIVNLYNTNGLAIFKSYSRPNENNNDPFRPENIKGIENPYEPLTTLPFQNAQPTIMQSYSQNDYIHSLLPISQSIQTPIDSSYVYPTNLPISFPYYSNSSVQLNNCPPTQNSYSFTPYLANANSYS